jgi:transcription antitermination factor NusA-like protein
VKKLFALEVPEIADGTVEIAAVAREAGHRTKIAVRSRRPGVNPKGACIGPMGSRVRNVMIELHGEKIDIIDWSEDPGEFVGNALSPARVSHVEVLDLEGRVARVIVPDYQLSLAIGKEGQNARLAAKLTGWRIDIKSASSVEADRLERARLALSGPIALEDEQVDLEPAVAELLPPVAAQPEPVEVTLAAASVATPEAPAAPAAEVAAAPEQPAFVAPPRQPEAAEGGRRARVRFAEEIISDSRAKGPASRATRQEEEDAEKAAKTRTKRGRTNRAYTEVDDETEEYEDILRRLKN